jgi:hypothetical protein
MVVRVIFGDEGRDVKLGLHAIIKNSYYLMNHFEEDEYHIWKIKLELAKQGNSQAIE